MPTDGRLERVRALREQGRTPKQVARILGISQAEVGELVRAVASTAREDQAALAGCWISPGWSTGLAISGDPGWPEGENTSWGSDGLISVLVARRHRYGRVSVCGYLVDAYCLGVKNALGPEVMDDRELRAFLPRYFSSYDASPLQAPIELAREVVFGSVEYARGLGFEPHRDFAAAAGHLGEWTGPSVITFGRDGRPVYVTGPHDNTRSIIRTLKRNVGSGNFDVVAIGG
jgi:hypothetical protein